MSSCRRQISKRFQCVALILAIQLLGACSESSSPTEPSGTGGRILTVSFVAQQTPVWCWAAVSEMVFRYYGRGATQCQILSGWFGANCCSSPGSCQTTGSIPAIQQTLLAFGGISSSYFPGPLTLQAVASEIDGGRPIIAAYRGSFSGHVVVIYGYDPAGNLYIHDPFYGSFVVPYAASFTYGGQLVWAETIYGIR